MQYVRAEIKMHFKSGTVLKNVFDVGSSASNPDVIDLGCMGWCSY